MWLLPNTKSPLAQVPIPVSRMCFRVCEQLVFSVVQRQSEGSFGDLQLLLTQPFVHPYLLQGGSNHVTITAQWPSLFLLRHPLHSAYRLHPYHSFDQWLRNPVPGVLLTSVAEPWWDKEQFEVPALDLSGTYLEYSFWVPGARMGHLTVAVMVAHS